MKILYVDQTGKLGGGELAILPWICRAHENAAVLLFEDGPFRPLIEACGVPVEILKVNQLKKVRRESGFGSALAILPDLWRMRSCLRQRSTDFDVLYANSQKAFLLCALAKRSRQVLVWHLRDIMTAEHFSPMLRRIAVFFGNRFATVVVVNSKATGRSFVEAGGDARKVRVVHDGVSAEPFDQLTDADIAEARASIPAPAGAVLIGLFSRISPWKGQHVLLEAVRELPNVHAVLVGDSLFGEEAYAERIRRTADSAQFAGRVHLLGFRRDVPALMKAMDILAHTSTAPEPFGLVIVEGMLAGRPVIATAAGGALEIVQGELEGDAALLTTPGSAEQLRDAIKVLIANPDWARALAERGQRRARLAFSLPILFARLAAILASDCHVTDS